MVVFPYSDGIGRGGDWPSLDPKGPRSKSTRKVDRLRTQVSREIVISSETSTGARRRKAPLTLTIRTKPLMELSSGELLEIDGEPAEKGFEMDGPVTTFRKIWKQKQSKNLDRTCFICHQKLLASQDVAALVNVKTGQMICGSRNRRGVCPTSLFILESDSHL